MVQCNSTSCVANASFIDTRWIDTPLGMSLCTKQQPQQAILNNLKTSSDMIQGGGMVLNHDREAGPG